MIQSCSAFRVMVALLSLVTLGARGDEASQPGPGRPNIVFLLADDLRWDALGYAGHPLIKTPNIDSLARRGMAFRNSFVTTPICAVSRATALTGQYARRHGVHDFATAVPDLAKTYPGLLGNSGYYTGFIGKWGVKAADASYLQQCAKMHDFWAGDRDQTSYWHERNCNYITNNGTTDRENYHCNCPPEVWKSEGVQNKGPHPALKDPVHLETWVIPRKVRQFLDQRDTGKPFALQVSFKAPHGPIGGWAPQFAGRFQGATMPLRPNATPQAAEQQPEFLRESLESPRGFRIAHERDPASPEQELLRDYHRLVEGLDFAVGEVLGELGRRHLTSNTVVIFTSDNGHMHGEHGFYGKWLMYEESIRVPLVIYDPRPGASRTGGEIQSPALNIDWAPTILDLAGVPVPDYMQGQSLRPLLNEPDKVLRDTFFVEHLYEHGAAPPMRIEPSEALVAGNWKFIHYIKQTGSFSRELYNLALDPLELTNRAAAPAASTVLRDLEAKYQELSQELGPHNTWKRPSPPPGSPKKGPAKKKSN